jgi:predicted metal-dependent peptidase
MNLKPTLQFDSFTKLHEWKTQQSLVEAADSQNAPELDEVKEDIERAIALLMGRFPFFGAFIYKFRIIYVPGDDPDITTMATDGANIFINPVFSASLTDAQTVFVLCHEILHNVMLHFVRQQNKGAKDHQRWNIAADYEINPMCVDEGLISAADLTGKMHGLYDEKYLDMPAEEIYDKIGNQKMPQPPGQPQSGDGKGQPQSGDGKPQPPQDDEGEGEGAGGEAGEGGSGSGASSKNDGNEYSQGNGLGGIIDVDKSVEKQKELGVPVKTGSEAEADKLIKEAMSEAKKLKGGGDRGTGKGLLQRAIERLSKPQVNWKNELRRIVGKITSGSEEYFGKRKHLYRGEYFYGDRDADSDRLKEAVVAVDTSGSIGDDQLVAFLTEITAIIKAKQIKKTEIIYFDYGITGRDIVKNPPKFDIKQAKGGGGTSFIDPMNAIYEKWKKGKLELAVFFTDGYGDQGSAEFEAIIKKMKKFERSFIWLVIDNPGFVAPFGKVIHAKAVK